MHTIHLRERNSHTGMLRIRCNRYTRAIRARPSVISIMPYLDSDRARVVRFIQAGYRRHFGARMHVDYPNLISVCNTDGRPIAAAGFRFAELSPLFLEQYTDRAIHEILGVERRRIVEIGNLVSRGGGTSIFIITALVSYFDSIGISHGAITGTETLERRLRRVGIVPWRLCAADPAKVAHLGQSWGSYYASRPSVLAGPIQPVLAKLRDIFGEAFFTPRPRLFPRMFFAADQY